YEVVSFSLLDNMMVIGTKGGKVVCLSTETLCPKQNANVDLQYTVSKIAPNLMGNRLLISNESEKIKLINPVTNIYLDVLNTALPCSYLLWDTLNQFVFV